MISSAAARWCASLACALGVTADAGAAQTSAPLPEWRYTVRPADTLIGVASRYLAKPSEWTKVQAHNGIQRPRRLVPGSVLRIPLAWLRQTPAPAAVVAVSGPVTVTLPGEASRAALSGALLASGSVLETAVGGRVSVRFADGSIAVLQPGARLVLDTVSVYAGGGMVDTRMRLQQGRVEVDAPQQGGGNRLRVITPSAVAAVRGTRFRVAATDSVTREETLEGAVGLSASGQTVTVDAGWGTLAEQGRAPRPPVPLLPPAELSGLPPAVRALPLHFVFPPLANAVAWTGQVAEDASFQQVLLDARSDAPALNFGDLPDGQYVLRVRAVDTQGLEGRDAVHTFTLDARPFAPLPSAPDARVRTSRPTFRWHGVVGAAAYRLELARDASFADPIVAVTTHSMQLTLTEALRAGDYYWRMASIDQTGTGPFSPIRQVRYVPAPDAPVLSEATPAFRDHGLVVDLPPPAPSQHYEWVLSTDPERRERVSSGISAAGRVAAAPVDPARLYLAARLVDDDGTAGPFAVRVIEPPPARFRWEWLLLLAPLFAL